MIPITTVMTVALIAQALNPIESASRVAEVFWDQFMAVQSIERVTQSKLEPDGKIISTKSMEFDYVASLKPKSAGVAVEESRVPRSSAEPEAKASLLLTSGFPTLLLMFHPDFRDKFEFSESTQGNAVAGVIRVAFRSRSQQHSMSAIRFNGHLYPILWRGYAWIDVSAGNVTRIEANLVAPMNEIGVSELRAEVEYKLTPLREHQQTYMLPAKATIWLRTRSQHWRNVHEFSAYKAFTVTTSTRAQQEAK
jgi:hypothetical protein